MGEKKNVLFITHWYPNSDDPHRGIFIRNHAIVINEISTLVVVDFSIRYSKSLFKKRIYRSKDNFGLDTVNIQIRSRFYKFLYYFVFFQNYILKQALRELNLNVASFDLIQSNVLFPSGIVAFNLAKKHNVTLVHIEHWSYASQFLKSDIHRRKGKRALNYASKIVAVSRILKNQLSEFVDPSKIEIIPNAVNEYFSPVRKRQDLSSVVRFVAVANWCKPKNPDLFVNALSEIQYKYPDLVVELTIVGDGEQLERIQNEKTNYKINFVGQVDNRQLSKYYNNADIFLHASDFETFSIVTIEAMLSGLPVVGSAVGVLPEVINESNGVLCENNVKSWIEGIEKVMNSTYDGFAISDSIRMKFSRGQIEHGFKNLYNSL